MIITMTIDCRCVPCALIALIACALGACQWVLDLEDPEPTGALASACSTGAARQCGTDVGECSQGLQLCVDGTWEATCRNEVAPRDELCNGHDDDCDGTADEGLRVGDPCDGEDADQCVEGAYECDTAGLVVCSDSTSASVEVCDGLDNDCNPKTPEDCSAGDCVLAKEGDKVVLGYLFCKARKTWRDARKVCADNKFRLARINDQIEDTRLRALATSVEGGDYWIGGTDEGHQDDWLWEDGTPFWLGLANGMTVGGAYTNWDSGKQPDDADGGEDCAEILGVSSVYGRWNDDPCDRLQKFICERY